MLYDSAVTTKTGCVKHALGCWPEPLPSGSAKKKLLFSGSDWNTHKQVVCSDAGFQMLYDII